MNLYIGKPYSFRSFNCYDYAALIRKENNIKTRLFKPRNLGNAFEIITAEMQKLDNGLTKVDSPQNFDICMMAKTVNKRKQYHVGVWYNGGVAHCSRDAKQVIYSTLNEFSEGSEATTFWR